MKIYFLQDKLIKERPTSMKQQSWATFLRTCLINKKFCWVHFIKMLFLKNLQNSGLFINLNYFKFYLSRFLSAFYNTNNSIIIRFQSFNYYYYYWERKFLIVKLYLLLLTRKMETFSHQTNKLLQFLRKPFEKIIQ